MTQHRDKQNSSDHSDEHADHKHDLLGGHSHAPASFSRAFAIGIALNLTFVVVEAAYGLRAHSLSLVADAGHNFGDVLGLVLAWAAAELAKRLPSTHCTYGMRRFSILAALANALLLIAAIGAISWEAVQRLRNPEPVQGGVVMAVASIGILINAFTAYLFARGRKGDLNIRGAYLHMAADALVSAGVVIAGLVIWRTNWLWLDPAVSLAVVVIIAVGTWDLLRDSVNLALDAVPPGVDASAVEAYLASLPGVKEVHDLHIWGMSTTEVALTAHLIKPDNLDNDAMLLDVCHELEHRFRIHHATLQIERGDGPTPCGLRASEVV